MGLPATRDRGQAATARHRSADGTVDRNGWVRIRDSTRIAHASVRQILRGQEKSSSFLISFRIGLEMGLPEPVSLKSLNGRNGVPKDLQFVRAYDVVGRRRAEVESPLSYDRK